MTRLDDDSNELDTYELARRAVLKATGGVAALSLGAGTAAAGNHRSAPGTGESASNPNDIDPVFGKVSLGPSPCNTEGHDDAETTDCFEQFRPPVRPSHEVDLHIGIADELLALAGALENDQDLLDDVPIGTINEAVADGSLDEDTVPEGSLTIPTPPGRPSITLNYTELAELLVESVGFHYDPAGLRARPGDVVIFDAESPDHGVTAYHERHGRQNRVPDDVGPISSPLVPVGGYWLYEFPTEGVYDLYCPPHEAFGMAMRVVVTESDNPDDAPAPSVEQTGRPPTGTNALAGIFGGLNPNVPSAHDVLHSSALSPDKIVEEDEVDWHEIVDEHRSPEIR